MIYNNIGGDNMARDIDKRKRRGASKNFLFDGIIFALLGIAMLVWPNDALKVLCIVCGGCLVLMGVIRLIIFFTTEREIRKISDIVISVLQLAAGAVLIFAADFFVSVFFVVCGLILAYGAFLLFFRAIQLRRIKGVMYYLALVFGFVSLAFAVIVILNLSQFAEAATRIQGAALTLNGIGMIIVLRNMRLSLQPTKERV